MVKGWPDFTLPITIVAVEVAAIPIDIKAQTLGVVKIDISAQSLGQVNVNLAASAITLDVRLTASTVTLNVNIASISGGVVFNVAQSGSWTVNAAQTGSWTINIGAPLDPGGNVKVDVMQSVQLNVNIAASAVTLQVNIASQSANLNVNLAASAITLNVAIQSSAVTLNVNLSSQSVDINIKTSGGANIVIDKLTQTAYVERRGTLSNDNGVTTPTAPPASITGVAYYGKWFARGCLGEIGTLSIYCKRTGTGTLTLSYAPFIGQGAVGSVQITPGTDWDWKSATLNKPWLFDTLFIWVSACSADVSFGYDTTTPYDGYSSADSGATWGADTRRYFIRALMWALSVGPLPVSGVINVVTVPAASGRYQAEGANIPNTTVTTILTLAGAGILLQLVVYFDIDTTPSTAVAYAVSIQADGSDVVVLGNRDICGSVTATSGQNPVAQFYQYSTPSARTAILIWLPVQFKRELVVRLFQSTGAPQTANAYATANVIR